MINQATIEEIKNRMDIVEVVGDFVNLKKSGSSYKALSPFTAEKTPSFYVVPSKGIFKCFSSGKGGDAITFIMEVDGLSYLEALKFLANKYGIEIIEEERTDEAQLAQNKRESLYIILQHASDYYSRLLHDHEEGQSIGMSYFRERGFSATTIDTFKLGYSLQDWDHFYKEALGKGFDEDLIEEAGLIIRKEGKTYDRFRGRVLFPIQNVTGKVIGFGGRILTSDKKQPKYINSPETELYNKSKVLFGISQARHAIRKLDNCYLVEGYTDVISMHQAGVENVVASSGTALTEDQVKLIKRYTENVTVLFDGDAAGIRASFRGIDLLLEGGLNVRVIALPDGQDPDSYSRALGTSAFQHFLTSESRDFIVFKASLLLEDAQHDPVKRAGIIRDIVQSITKIGDPIKRSVYIKECSSVLDISEQILISEQNKLLITKSRENKGQQPVEPSPLPVRELMSPQKEEPEVDDIGKIIAYQEKESIRVLINYGNEMIRNSKLEDEKIVHYFLSETDEIHFTHPVYNKILGQFREKALAGEIVDATFFLDSDDEDIRKTVIELSATRYEISEFWESKYGIHVPHEADHLKDVTFTNILRLKFRIIQHLIRTETDKLKHLDGDSPDEIIEEIQDLKKMEMEIARILGNVTIK
ncbi:MAG: DNA primase [Cyclobacteriaceae bacterium]|nr:DNA primase [Cyclobacteriaceae bacterium]